MDKLSLWAQKTYQALHYYLNKYCGKLPEEWLGGIVYVECASLNPKASRFEEKVYQSVMWVKKGNKSQAYPAFNQGPIHDLIAKINDISILKSIATSYGHGQLMGYNYITHMSWGPEKYMALSVEDSIQAMCKFANDQYSRIRFLQMSKNGKVYLPYEQLLRIWNGGSPTAKTYNPDYVKNATSMAAHYKAVMDQSQVAFEQNSLTEGDLNNA